MIVSGKQSFFGDSSDLTTCGSTTGMPKRKGRQDEVAVPQA